MLCILRTMERKINFPWSSLPASSERCPHKQEIRRITAWATLTYYFTTVFIIILLLLFFILSTCTILQFHITTICTVCTASCRYSGFCHNGFPNSLHNTNLHHTATCLLIHFIIALFFFLFLMFHYRVFILLPTILSNSVPLLVFLPTVSLCYILEII
jgi:hypothetical protein